ncbi:hypothetical protein ACIBCT_12675 [Streptosporangium sp. NPDC050855]|uniref:hypothetical protein n=1 Tax=Streptosporangium sp. NPDC050855 TaxID=3366194 RepID=UPI00378A3D92
MKSILMPSQMGLASARRNTVLPCAVRTLLTVGAAAPVSQDDSAHFQIEARRWATPAAFPATVAPATAKPVAFVPAAETRVGDSYAAMTQHIGNGGLRGPQPWRHPPVMT